MSEELYDLRNEYKHKINKNINNMLIVNILSKLVAQLKAQDPKKNNIKIASITKAINNINALDHDILSAKESLEIPGIGKGISQRIDEILKTKTLKELDVTIDPETELTNKLMEITGIGIVKARKLIELGVKSIPDLINKYNTGELKVEKNVLTHHIARGIEFYNDLKLRAPWKEIDDIGKLLKVYNTDPKLHLHICGSYRRKMPTCGDIDVLLVHDEVINDSDIDIDYLNIYVNILKEKRLIVGSLTSEGTTKYMGVIKLGPEYPGRRIDIRFVTMSALPAALLYFTGSGQFNKIMRNYANEKGYTINEYGIFRLKDGEKAEQIPVKTEEDIFHVIGCMYIPPEERSLNSII